MAGLCEHDQKAAEFAVQLKLNGGIEVLFQFPPTIDSDEKSVEWKESQVGGDEPVASWASAGPRTWSLSWTYILGFGGWDGKKIHDQISGLRKYFYFNSGGGISDCVAQLYLGDVGGDGLQTVRLCSVSVTHSKMWCGSSRHQFPLKTDVKCSIKLWTNGVAQKSASTKLSNKVSEGWY